MFFFFCKGSVCDSLWQNKWNYVISLNSCSEGVANTHRSCFSCKTVPASLLNDLFYSSLPDFYSICGLCCFTIYCKEIKKKHLRLVRKEYTCIMKAAYILLSRHFQLLKTTSLSSNAISDHVNDLARDTYSVSLNKNIKYDIVVPLGNSSDLNYILLEDTL